MAGINSRFLIEPKVKKIDGIWYLHGKNIRIFDAIDGDYIGISLITMKKGQMCGIHESWEILLGASLDRN